MFTKLMVWFLLLIYVFVLHQERDEILPESYARIEHMLSGCWLHALKGKKKKLANMIMIED